MWYDDQSAAHIHLMQTGNCEYDTYEYNLCMRKLIKKPQNVSIKMKMGNSTYNVIIISPKPNVHNTSTTIYLFYK